MLSCKHANISIPVFLNRAGAWHSSASTQKWKVKRIYMIITWLLTPLQCRLPFASPSDGRRQKGHEPGKCAYFESLGTIPLFRGLIWLSLLGKQFPNTHISSEALTTGRGFQRKPFWRRLLLCKNVCCAICARFQLEPKKSFLLLALIQKHLPIMFERYWCHADTFPKLSCPHQLIRPRTWSDIL